MVDAKLTVSVCLPARNEEATVGAIVATVVAELAGLVDEVVVVDDGSTDATAAVAATAGAKVVSADRPGKGQALWKAMFVASGELLVFCDADIRHFSAGFVTALLEPLLASERIAFVKGFYQRPDGGGRVTELVARPVLSLLFPELAGILQPLAGEFASRRHVLERVPFTADYGVDLGLLVDVWRLVGLEGLAQADLGVRHHRNRPLDDLGPQAVQVLRAALDRAGVAVSGPPTSQCPPLVEVPAYVAARRAVTTASTQAATSDTA